MTRFAKITSRPTSSDFHVTLSIQQVWGLDTRLSEILEAQDSLLSKLFKVRAHGVSGEFEAPQHNLSPKGCVCSRRCHWSVTASHREAFEATLCGILQEEGFDVTKKVQA